MLFAGKGKSVEVKRGRNEGLTGTVVGKSVSGKKKVMLNPGLSKHGNSIIKVKKSKLKKD
jgi:hypothetical protein